MAYDPSIVAAIKRRAREVSDPSKRNKYTRAALQTGIVESGLQNLPGGDADSAGWRQERASLYDNPTNVTASVDRFFNELAQFDKGQPSWELAADVQRPAAQYRGRYKDVASQAAKLAGGGGGGGTRSTAAQMDNVPEEQAQPTLTNALANLTLPVQARAQVSGPSAPAFAASAPTPTAYQTPVTTFAPKERFGGAQITDALTALQQSQQQIQQSAAQTVKNAGDGVADADDIQTAEAAPNAYAARASKIDAQKLPYSWGGGHAGKVSLKGKIVPLDCSGAVSAVLGINPRVSGEFESWGKSGRSKSKSGVNVYANDEHVLMEIGGRFFGTSQTNPGGGAGWIPRSALSKGYLSRFTVRHL